MTERPLDDKESLPTLWRDVSFLGMLATQFLGAFNDNLYKQLILLLAIDKATRADAQGIATIVFAVPFVLFSGFAGFLADRYSKRTIVVLSKVAEIAVMLLGAAAFVTGSQPFEFTVLFFMGAQSAFFGPSKYGILPEMLRSHDLPRANGVIQMTTFLAIIFGFAAAGLLLTLFPENYWIAGLACVATAAVGTGTSLFVRRTPVAQPGLGFDVDALFLSRPTLRLIGSDRRLLGILLLSSVFWFIGGVVHQTVNAVGKQQFGLDEFYTSMLATSLAIGISAGCVIAGMLSKNQINFSLVHIGAWGIVGALAALSAPTLVQAQFGVGIWEWWLRIWLALLGVFAGFFAVPLNVFLQAWPPPEQKGRIIGAMNLVNWIAISLCGAFYAGTSMVLAKLEIQTSATFLLAGLIMLPIAIMFRPPDAALDNSQRSASAGALSHG